MITLSSLPEQPSIPLEEPSNLPKLLSIPLERPFFFVKSPTPYRNILHYFSIITTITLTPGRRVEHIRKMEETAQPFLPFQNTLLL